MLRSTAFTLALLFAAPAFAQTAPEAVKPTIPWNTVLKAEDGRPFIDHCEVMPTIEKPDGVGCAHLTLRRAVAHALYAGEAGEKPNADASFARGMLAHQIETDAPTALDTEQSATVKRLMGGIYPAIIIYQAFPVLFPNDKPGAIK